MTLLNMKYSSEDWLVTAGTTSTTESTTRSTTESTSELTTESTTESTTEESITEEQSCCKSVTLSATGEAAEKFPSYLGTYAPIGQDQGAPIYGKVGGGVLIRQSDSTWTASQGIGDTTDIRSVDAAPCPANISQWQYKEDSIPISADITVNCSQHWK